MESQIFFAVNDEHGKEYAKRQHQRRRADRSDKHVYRKSFEVVFDCVLILSQIILYQLFFDNHEPFGNYLVANGF